jgi:SAM-dependent methyltransferase
MFRHILNAVCGRRLSLRNGGRSRDEEPGDIAAISNLITKAFRLAPHSSGTEAQCHAHKGVSTVNIPRIFNIAESAHRIHNPFTPEKLATLGAALRLETGTRVLDLGSGSGEMLCTWARDYGISGTGIDMSPLFTEQAKLRADELGIADRVEFIHGDATGYVADEKAGVAACVGATWIAGGVAGTIELLAKSLRTGGIILVGEPYWLQLPPTEEVAKGCRAVSISDFLLLPELLASLGSLGYDVVEMVLADQDSWDRYEAAKWLTMRRWLEANPDDVFAKDVRVELTSAPERYARYTREYLGWGVFALMSR